jgi:PBP1b-binding outer membrane lipoprotein LpoB
MRRIDMKIMARTLSLVLGILFLAGCSSCPCKKSVETVAPAAVAKPVVMKDVPAPIVSAPEEPAEASIPVKTRKYVSK